MRDITHAEHNTRYLPVRAFAVNSLLNITCGVTNAIQNWLFGVPYGSVTSPYMVISNFITSANSFFGKLNSMLSYGHTMVGQLGAIVGYLGNIGGFVTSPSIMASSMGSGFSWAGGTTGNTILPQLNGPWLPGFSLPSGISVPGFSGHLDPPVLQLPYWNVNKPDFPGQRLNLQGLGAVLGPMQFFQLSVNNFMSCATFSWPSLNLPELPSFLPQPCGTQDSEPGDEITFSDAIARMRQLSQKALVGAFAMSAAMLPLESTCAMVDAFPEALQWVPQWGLWIMGFLPNAPTDAPAWMAYEAFEMPELQAILPFVRDVTGYSSESVPSALSDRQCNGRTSGQPLESTAPAGGFQGVTGPGTGRRLSEAQCKSPLPPHSSLYMDDAGGVCGAVRSGDHDALRSNWVPDRGSNMRPLDHE